MSDPLLSVQRMIDQWERDAVEKAERYENMREEVEQISITESAADGAVRVTVGHNEMPADIVVTDGVNTMRPMRIAAAVMQAMMRAQSRYPAELARNVRDTVRRPDPAHPAGRRAATFRPQRDIRRRGTARVASVWIRHARGRAAANYAANAEAAATTRR